MLKESPKHLYAPIVSSFSFAFVLFSGTVFPCSDAFYVSTRWMTTIEISKWTCTHHWLGSCGGETEKSMNSGWQSCSKIKCGAFLLRLNESAATDEDPGKQMLNILSGCRGEKLISKKTDLSDSFDWNLPPTPINSLRCLLLHRPPKNYQFGILSLTFLQRFTWESIFLTELCSKDANMKSNSIRLFRPFLF